MRVGHAELFTLVDIRGALHAVQHHAEHLRGVNAVFSFITEARHDAWLVVVTPEQRIPGFVVHPLLPVTEEGFQRDEVRLRLRPFFAAGIIDLQVVEVKGHRQLAAVERSILLAVLQRGRGHLAHRHQITWGEDVAAHLLQILVDARPVCIETAAVTGFVIREILIFRNQVNDVETQAIHAAIGPELAHFFQLGAHVRVLPVEIRLLRGKQVQIILLALGVPAPGVAAELGAPVVRKLLRRAVAPDVKLAVRTGFVQRFPEPGVLRGGVVKHHIQHDANAARVRLGNQRVKIIQRAVSRVDGGVVRHVVAVIHLRGDIERRQPDGIDAEGFEVVKPLRHAA